MPLDTTTPEGDTEPSQGKLIRLGLKNGQQIIVLTTEPVENDLGLLVIQAANGDVLTVDESFVAWTRRSVVDMPTEDEIAAYEDKLKAVDSGPTAVQAPGVYL